MSGSVANHSRAVYTARIRCALDYVNENLVREINLQQVAQAAHFSPYHFHRIFTALVGETPHDYILRLRLERAANMLVKMPGWSITQVAYACGFTSSSVFARVFKKHFGVPASRYSNVYASIELAQQAKYENSPVYRQLKNRFEKQLATDVRIKHLPALHLAYIPNMEGYSREKIDRAWYKLCKWANTRGLFEKGQQLVGLSIDDPLITADERCRYYACVTVPSEMTVDNQVGVIDLPAWDYAVWSLSCEASELRSAYRAFFGFWLPDSGYQIGESYPLEIYYAAPEAGCDGLFSLDLCFPVEPL